MSAAALPDALPVFGAAVLPELLPELVLPLVLPEELLPEELLPEELLLAEEDVRPLLAGAFFASSEVSLAIVCIPTDPSALKRLVCWNSLTALSVTSP